MSSYVATIKEDQHNWSNLTIEVFTTPSIEAAEEQNSDPVATIWVRTSAYTGLDDPNGNVDFDQHQFLQDIMEALVPEWIVVDWLTSRGPVDISSDVTHGPIIGASVVPA